MDTIENSGQSASRISIKLGKLEIEFTGSEAYIRNGLPELIHLLSSYSVEDEEEGEILSEEEAAKELPENPDPASHKLQMTTNTISAKLSVKSGPDLVLASCVYMTLVKGVDVFERSNILAEMKAATHYFNKNYVNNLSQYLTRLLKDGKLIERKTNTYALQAKYRQDVESLLRESSQ